MRTGTYRLESGETVKVQRTASGYRVTRADGSVTFVRDEVAR